MIYPTLGGGIGALLRMIQEEKSQSPLMPPSADVGSPIRGVVQGPIKSPESPGSSRMVSIRPEAAISPENPVQPDTGAPVAPAGLPPVSPVASRPIPTPVPTPAPPRSSPASPQFQAPSPAPARVTAPSLATKITPATGVTIRGPEPRRMPYGFSGPEGVPQPSRAGAMVIAPPNPIPTATPAPGQPRQFYPTPTPTPTPKQAPQPSQSNLFNQLATIIKKSPWQYLFGR